MWIQAYVNYGHNHQAEVGIVTVDPMAEQIHMHLCTHMSIYTVYVCTVFYYVHSLYICKHLHTVIASYD